MSALARALLQAPDVLILDESLASLDPETRLQVLEVVSRRAGTLVLIAHGEQESGGVLPEASRACASGHPEVAAWLR